MCQFGAFCRQNGTTHVCSFSLCFACVPVQSPTCFHGTPSHNFATRFCTLLCTFAQLLYFPHKRSEGSGGPSFLPGQRRLGSWGVIVPPNYSTCLHACLPACIQIHSISAIVIARPQVCFRNGFGRFGASHRRSTLSKNRSAAQT